MILQTKTIPPQLGEPFVTRPRLCVQLNGVLQRRVGLVCAPAGYGKTSLLGDWLRTLPAYAAGNGGARLHVAWLALDRHDDDLARFLGGIIAAMRRQKPTVGQLAAAMLAQPQRPDPRAPVTALLNELQGARGTFVMVLDDFHLLQNREVLEATNLLLAGLPPNAHVVIGSRAEPPLPLARLRASAQLVELRAGDLRFTAQESAGFLNEAMGLDLPAENVALLDRRCEGWIAGLQLAVLACQTPPAATFERGHAHVFDYLAQEVLNQQAPHVQQFLLRTSIVARVCQSLCDALLQDEARQDTHRTLLQTLVAGNLFLAPLDEEGRWFRYHHLFQTFLRRELALRHGSEQRQLQRRASDWYAQNGFPEEAVRHALAAGDVNRAAELVGQAIGGRFQRGDLLTIRHFLEMLPDEAILARHNFCVGYAWVLALAGEVHRVEKYLQAAEQHLLRLAQLEPPPFDVAAQRSNVALVRANVAQRRGDAGTMARLARSALQTLGEAGAPALRSIAAYTLGQAGQMSGQAQEAQQALQQAAAHGEAAGHQYMAASALIALADLRRRQGRLQTAETIYRRVVTLAESENGAPARLVGGILGLAALALQGERLAQAAELALRAVDLGEASGEATSAVRAHTLLALVQQAQDKQEAARRNLLQALKLAQSSGFARLFVDEGPQLALMLRDLQDHAGVGAYAGHLLQNLEVESAILPQSAEQAEPLTKRQREILTLLAKGLSNREIARQLVISLETVRWHTKQIYRRLDVRNRTEAAAYARGSSVLSA